MDSDLKNMPKTRQSAERFANTLKNMISEVQVTSDAQTTNDIRILANALDEMRTKVNVHFTDEPTQETPITTLADLRKLLHLYDVLIDQYKSR